MVIARSQNPIEPNKTIITASGIYVDILSKLTYEYGNNATSSTFTAVCTIEPSGRWEYVRFMFSEGIFTVQSTNTSCSNNIESRFTGFSDAFYAIEGSTRIVIDGL